MSFWFWRRRVHLSWLIMVLALGSIGGVVLARFMPLGLFASPVWLLVAFLLAGIGLWRQRYYAVPVMLIAGSLLGIWRGSLVTMDQAQYQPLYGHTLKVQGKVADDPTTDASNSLVLRLSQVRIDGISYGGTLWLSVSTHFLIKRSDIVYVQGKLLKGFGTFSGVMYRATVTRAERPINADPARDARDFFADKIRLAIPEPQASLGIGYLVGQKSALPADLAAAFVTAGLTHVVVASGYNLTILVRLTRRVFARISKYLATFAAFAMIAGFMAVTGLSPSMSRAGLVAALSLGAWYYGRTIHPLVLLPLAAGVTILVNPSYAWGDLGWSLSFAAFGGVMILGPLLQSYFFGEKKPGFIRQVLGETIAAQIATLPILVFAFGQFSNVALIANLLILPLVPLAMLLTFVGGIGAIILPNVALLIGAPATWLLGYMTSATRYFADLPWAVTKITVSPIVVLLSYLGLVGLCAYLWYHTRHKLKADNLVQ